MTRAKTKAQRRADKRRARQAMPDLAAIPRRALQGRKRMQQIADEKNAAKPVLEARCRQAGLRPSPEAMRDMKAPWNGCNAGKAMALAVQYERERAELWEAIKHMRRVFLAYDAAIGAPRRHATCLRLLAPSEAIEANAETPPVDDRTEQEKYDDAIARFMELEGWLGHVEGRAASICKRVVVDDERCTDPQALIRALFCIADGMSGRRVIYRGIDK